MLMKYYWFLFLVTLIKVHIAFKCGTKCLKCNETNSKCLICPKGLYESFGDCTDKCEDDLYADNYSMSCKKMTNNPVYIKAFTAASCVNMCGKEYGECSCNIECRRRGNCCSDFKFCEIILDNVDDAKMKNETLNNCKYQSKDSQMCIQCEDNFYYHNGQCVEKCLNDTITNDRNKLCIPQGSKLI
jgi:hypothetical protein